MTVFISYARKDRELVQVLARDIERAKQQVWLDDDLTGGQDWWDTVLAQIRGCRLFIFVLTPDSIRSKACLAELGYASDLARSIVPVMVRDVAVRLAPLSISRAHIVDYRERTADSAVDLTNALAGSPSAGPLPVPLPEPPTLPASYATSVHDQIGADSLTLPQQGSILMELKAHLRDAEERDVVLELLRDLRRRSDITELVALEIDRLVAEPSLVGIGPMPRPDVAADSAASGERPADPLLERTGAGPNAESLVERDAKQVGPIDARHATHGDSAPRIGQTSHRRRNAVIVAAVGVAMALMVTAVIALTRGGQDSDELDAESAASNFQEIMDETEFDDEGQAEFADCPLGDIMDLAHAVDDVVPLSTETLEGDTFSGGVLVSDDVPRIYCGILDGDHEDTDGIWAFSAHSIGASAQDFDGYDEWGADRNGRIVHEESTDDDNNRFCASFWVTDDADLVFSVELYGNGCTLDASSEALSAVLPDLVGSLT